MLLSKPINRSSVKFHQNSAYPTALDGLFYCASPLQILSAYEARQHFNLKDCLLLLNSFLSNEHGGHNYYLDLVSDLGWERVITLDRSKRSRFFSQVNVLKTIEQISFSKAFIGEWSSFGRMIYWAGKFHDGFLLDDGVATLRQQREIVDPHIHLPWRKRVRDLLRDARFFPFGYQKRAKPVISFFSTMVKEPLKRERLVSHDFHHLRKAFAQSASGTGGPAVFLGTHLDSHPEFSFEKLGAMHVFAAERFKEALPFDLYLHRSESIDRVSCFVPKCSYRIHSYTEPIEVRILRLGLQPRLIVSPMSSGLITLKALCPESRVVALDVRGFLDSPDQAGWVYELFASHDIEVIQVPVPRSAK